MNLHDAVLNAPTGFDLGASSLLPRLDPMRLQACNRLYRRHEPVVLALEPARRCLVRWRWRQEEDDRPAADAACYAFRLGGSNGELSLSTAAQSALLGERQAALLPQALRYVLLADALAATVSRIEQASGLAFEWILSPGPGTAATAFGAVQALHFELAPDEAPQHWAHGALRIDTAALLEPLCAAWSPRAAPGGWHDELALPLSFELGRTSLSLRELRSIERGDIVAVEQWQSRGSAIAATPVLSRRHRLGMHALADGHRITLQTWKEFVMTDIGTQADSAHSGAPPVALERLGEIEVALRFEVGDLQVTLRELRSLQPGHVFDLGQPLNRSTVRILSHGNLLGHGHLVAVGERLGVRVVGFSADADV